MNSQLYTNNYGYSNSKNNPDQLDLSSSATRHNSVELPQYRAVANQHYLTAFDSINYVNLAKASCSSNSSGGVSIKLTSATNPASVKGLPTHSPVIPFNHRSGSSAVLDIANGIKTLTSSAGPSGASGPGPSGGDVRGFKCQICNRYFTQKGNLKTHLMTHSGEKPYECPTCGKNFTQKGNLDTHVKIHTDTKDHRCHFCDRGFTQRGNLKTHIRSVHTKEKPYICRQCGKAFSQKGNMLTHYRTHDKGSRFSCDVCGKTFSQKGNLKTHQQRHERGGR